MLSKLKAMRQVVLEELNHIPKGNNAQNELRFIYFNKRMHSLGKKAKEKKSAKDVLLESIAYIKKYYPEFEPVYDEDFFEKRCFDADNNKKVLRRR